MTSKRQSVYVIINKNYTATVYSLNDLKSYVERENLDAGYFTIYNEESGDAELTKEIKEYIQSFIVVEAEGIKRQVMYGLYLNYDEENTSVYFSAKEVADQITNFYTRCTQQYIKELEELPNWEILNKMYYRDSCYWTLSPDFDNVK